MVELLRSSIQSGVWRGEFSGFSEKPSILVMHLGKVLADVNVSKLDNDNWTVAAPIPSDTIADGVQTFLVQDSSGTTLTTFSMIAGDVLDQDLRAEINLLREELDLLKTAFRRHYS